MGWLWKRSVWQRVLAISAAVLAGSIALWPVFHWFTSRETRATWEWIIILLVCAVFYAGARVFVLPRDRDSS